MSSRPFMINSPSRQNARSLSSAPYKRPIRSNLSTKSLSQVVAKTSNYIVESIGWSLPVLVTEAITFADRSHELSAQISENGYGWITCNRRLLLWQYRQRGSSRLHNICYELALPPSDLVHKAQLVCVISEHDTNQNVSCVAISPEGVVRYWPSITHESVFVEQNVELHGQECDSLSYIENVGCILATTTCSLVLLKFDRRQIQHRLLKPPAGWLGGISRRLSSLIFGPMATSHSTTETRLVRFCTINVALTKWQVYLLASHHLQKWTMQLDSDGTGLSKNVVVNEELEQEFDLSRLVRDAFIQSQWNMDNPADIDVWMLDMLPVNDNCLLFLCTALNTHRSPSMNYAIVTIKPGNFAQTLKLETFQIIKYTCIYSQENEAELLSYKLLLHESTTYMYNHRCILIFAHFSSSLNEPEVVEFYHNHDKILGANVCTNTPLFLTRNAGLLTINSSDLSMVDTLNNSVSMSENNQTCDLFDANDHNLSLYNLDAHEITLLDKDASGQLKSAFLHFVKKKLFDCHEILNETFPLTGANDLNTPLDLAVVKVSTDLVNDVPACDPRWIERGVKNPGIGSCTSVQILVQLQAKQRALELFINFLKDTKLWARLTRVQTQGDFAPTTYILAEHFEKIIAAITIKKLHANHPQVIDAAIDKLVENDEHKSGDDLSNLDNQDLFFHCVTEIHLLVPQLKDICETLSRSELQPIELAKYISQTNLVILQTISEVVAYREKRVNYFKSPTVDVHEYSSWILSSGKTGVYDSVNAMRQLTYEYGVRCVSTDATLTHSLYDQYVQLTDILLHEKHLFVNSLAPNSDRYNCALQAFEKERGDMIKCLVDEKQYTRAIQLAEKYQDFNILITVCELTNDEHRLNSYIDNYSGDNAFSDYLFSWYMREKKHAKLVALSQKVLKTKKSHRLNDLVDDCKSLAWMQRLAKQEYQRASRELFNLASIENDYVTRKKSMLSISKLAQLADSHTDQQMIEQINQQLELIVYQENIPDDVMRENGLDANEPRVLSARDLIHLYVSAENADKCELDFKNALDLLKFVDGDSLPELKRLIYCGAILNDAVAWSNFNRLSSVDLVLGTTFFKLIDLCVGLDGCHPDDVLPPIHELIHCNELVELTKESTFEFLLRTGYEQIRENYKNENQI